jgi:hypothetical protein
METSQAAAVTDLMFKTVANGKTTFGDLAAYISQAAPTASALGVGLDQVLAAVATLTKQGVPTATAMTQIRNSMLALNGELGDGWSKSMTFQEALQKVGSEAGFSAVALEKAFGRENVGAVLAMIGENAANAAADLATMRAEGGGLEEAFAKVDSQVGHWPRIWQSIRELVSQVGEALDTKLKPVIDFVAKKLNALGDGKGFAGFVEGLSSRIADLVAQAVAGVQTVIDVLGKTSIGGAISATVNALVDLVVTLLAEGLRSLGTVVVALAKIFGAAIKGEVMKIDIWGRDETKAAREAARKNIANLSPEQAESLGVPSNVFGGDDAMMSQEQFKRRKKQQREYIDSLDLDQAVAIATANRDQDIGGALSQAGESFAASRERIGTAGGRIVEGLSRRTGVDVGATYEANLAGVRGALPGAPGPVASAAVPSAATAAPAAVSVAGSSAAAGTGAQRMADEAGAARKATEDSMDAATDLFRAFQESQRQQAQQMRDLKAAVSQIPNV